MRLHTPGDTFAASKIAQLDLLCLRVDKNVGGLEIAMDDVVGMEIVKFYIERSETFTPRTRDWITDIFSGRDSCGMHVEREEPTYSIT